MDCCYIKQPRSTTVEQLFANVSSPEMFDSDVENESNNTNHIVSTNEEALVKDNPEKPTQAELIVKSDNYLLARINKFLSGVPPPPSHTICQSDCNGFLLRIHQNREFFWTPYPIPEKKTENEKITINSSCEVKSESNQRVSFYRADSAPRNLISAFDACCEADNVIKTIYNKTNNDDNGGSYERLNSNNEMSGVINASDKSGEISSSSVSPIRVQKDISTKDSTKVEIECKDSKIQSLLLYNTVNEKEAAALTWPEVYNHKFHGIHYNRNKAIEEFENLTMKLCARYIGAETQSTCNVFFPREAPGSARKRSLIARRNCGQSPGKRLNHLTKRRKTFSSANLQGLGLIDKKQLVLNAKKPIIRRGKSPRGKSPRFKSPRGKSPRSSTKKKAVRKLILDSTSPHKSKVETSKRALFQSPPSDRPGPSKLIIGGNVNPQTIKRVLFPTSKKEDSTEESRKRKSEEELEGPRFKWAKSLSFDCSHELHSKSLDSWDNGKHSSSKCEVTLSQGRGELSDTHRKKLLWAVAEALRGRGIGMGHPQFKQYASNLARTVKKFMPDLENKNIPRKPGSTSDRMLKLAKHHALVITSNIKTNE